jgi:hypothetical protein
MHLKRALVFCLLLAGMFVISAADLGKPIVLSDLPAAVQKTINVQVGDGELADIEPTNEDGEATFDVSYSTKAGDERDFSVADDGTLLSVEVALDETPAAVQKTIRTQAAGWELESIDKNVADVETSFDVDVSKEGHENNFTVADDGELVSMEVALAATPAVVQAAVKSQAADRSLKSIDESFDPDGNTFDVEMAAPDGGLKSFTLGTDGRMLTEAVSLKQIPPPARKTIKEKIGDGRILRIDRSLVEKKDGVLPYNVQGRKDGRPFDFSVGPHGRFLGLDE